MSPKVTPVPKGFEALTPYLIIRGAAKAIDPIRKANSTALDFAVPVRMAARLRSFVPVARVRVLAPRHFSVSGEGQGDEGRRSRSRLMPADVESLPDSRADRNGSPYDRRC